MSLFWDLKNYKFIKKFWKGGGNYDKKQTKTGNEQKQNMKQK